MAIATAPKEKDREPVQLGKFDFCSSRRSPIVNIFCMSLQAPLDSPLLFRK